MIRIRLDEREFRDLVRGAVAKVRTSAGEEAELILVDIGYDRMAVILWEGIDAAFEPGSPPRDRAERGEETKGKRK